MTNRGFGNNSGLLELGHAAHPGCLEGSWPPVVLHAHQCQRSAVPAAW
jgi:hypothetical protein